MNGVPIPGREIEKADLENEAYSPACLIADLKAEGWTDKQIRDTLIALFEEPDWSKVRFDFDE